MAGVVERHSENCCECHAVLAASGACVPLALGRQLNLHVLFKATIFWRLVWQRLTSVTLIGHKERMQLFSVCQTQNPLHAICQMHKPLCAKTK